MARADPWASAHEDELRRLAVAEGLTNSVIAVRLNAKYGTSHTKNAIIGKRRRLGLVETRPDAKPAAIDAKPPGSRVTLLNRTRRQCGWPVNDGGPFLFCGAEKDDPKNSYCAYHRRLASRPAGQARRSATS